MRWGMVCVLVLATIAGCNALASEPPGPSTPAETVTPAPVPTDPTATDAPLPSVAPGVNTTGIADVTALVDGHVLAARNTSWVWQENSTVTETAGNVTATTTNRQTVTFEGVRSWRRQAGTISVRTGRELQFFQDYEQYANGQMHYEAWYSSERQRVVYRRQSATAVGPEFEGFAASSLRHYLPVESAVVSRINVGERPHYLIEGTRSVAPNYGTADSYRARAVVREDGFVRRLNVTYVVAYGDTRVEGSYRFSYRQIGNASVETPAWVDEARSEASR